MNRLIAYLRDTRAELRHVSWPTPKQAAVLTGLVVGITVLVALFTGAFDYLFTEMLNWLVR